MFEVTCQVSLKLALFYTNTFVCANLSFVMPTVSATNYEKKNTFISAFCSFILNSLVAFLLPCVEMLLRGHFSPYLQWIFLQLLFGLLWSSKRNLSFLIFSKQLPFQIFKIHVLGASWRADPEKKEKAARWSNVKETQSWEENCCESQC